MFTSEVGSVIKNTPEARIETVAYTASVQTEQMDLNPTWHYGYGSVGVFYNGAQWYTKGLDNYPS